MWSCRRRHSYSGRSAAVPPPLVYAVRGKCRTYSVAGRQHVRAQAASYLRRGKSSSAPLAPTLAMRSRFVVPEWPNGTPAAITT